MGCFQSSLSIWLLPLPAVHQTWTELCRKITFCFTAAAEPERAELIRDKVVKINPVCSKAATWSCLKRTETELLTDLCTSTVSPDTHTHKHTQMDY